MAMALRSGDTGSVVPDLADAIRGCAAGDKAALRLIYDAEGATMIAIAQRIVRDRAAAEDVVHDAFVQIWSKAKTFDPSRGLARSWLYAVVRHRALNMVRADRRLERVGDFEPLDLASPEEDAESIVTRMSDASALRRCLERLDPTRRALVVLAYVHGLTHGELAGRLRVPLGTMKSWMRRSLLALRDCLP
ncbi:MAG: sigma-70 family RNA polymerase sigma factor [Alsobacter sp.]